MDLRSHIKAVLWFLFLCLFLRLPNNKSPTAYANGVEPNLNLPQEVRGVKDLPIALRWREVVWGEGQSVKDIDDPNRVFIPLVMRICASPQNVQITDIFFDGLVPQSESDEYAEVSNNGTGPVNLIGWRLNAGSPGQDFNFPNFVIDPGQTCRVYTNEIHPETCGFSFESGVALWLNSGDCGYLYNQAGDLVSDYCYSGG